MSMDFKREDDSENPWRIDSARYKFAPYLIVHCNRTEVLHPTQTIVFEGLSAGPTFGVFTVT